MEVDPKDKATKPNPPPPPEAQGARWIKYGSNVVLSVILFIVVAGLVVFLAQKYSRHVDLTQGRVYSLKPQTLNIIEANRDPIKLVSLYRRPENDESARDHAQSVADLLEEYHRQGRNIDVEIIDPDREPTRMDQLFQEVAEKYGNQVRQYQDLLSGEFPKTVQQITGLASEEDKALAQLPAMDLSDATRQTLGYVQETVEGLPDELDQLQQLIGSDLKQKTPNYKGAVDAARSKLQDMSDLIGLVQGKFKDMAADKTVPDPLKQYAADSKPHFDQIKKIADDMVAQIDKLGQLKQLDDLRAQKSNSIVVMGARDMKVLGFGDVWKAAGNMRMYDADAKPPLSFAGEQQISTAIYSLGVKDKPKVVFIRPGGPPLTMSFTDEPMFSAVAQRLRDYDFDVSEKDITGQWQMQAMMRQMPTMPEPKDEDIRDAVWVVLDVGPATTQMGPSPMGPKLRQHLAEGGSALVMANLAADDLAVALKDWGVDVQTEALVVHEAIGDAGDRSSDPVDSAQRQPPVFILDDYGDGPIARACNSLDGLFAPLVPVDCHPTQGVSFTKLLPVPETAAKVWATRDYESLLSGGPLTPFTPARIGGEGDIPPPIFGGAALEKTGAGRLIVLGAGQFAMDRYVTFPDLKMLRQGRLVTRFPGNGELFSNCIFWLSKLDTMIAIGPEAMQVSRIAPMSPTMEDLLRIWLPAVLLPLAVVLAGAAVYLARRD